MRSRLLHLSDAKERLTAPSNADLVQAAKNRSLFRDVNKRVAVIRPSGLSGDRASRSRR